MREKPNDLLTAREASQLLNINEKKVYALAQEGKLPGTKVTGKWIFPRPELEEYLRSMAQQTPAQVLFRVGDQQKSNPRLRFRRPCPVHGPGILP